jgi:hypothetical protein
MFPDDNPYRSPQPFGGREAGDVENPPPGSLDAVQVEQPITVRFCWTADDLLQGYRYHWLPRRGFANDSDFERAAVIAKSKVQRIYHVT